MTKPRALHSPEVIDRVIDLWRSGVSATEIAVACGLVSRNSVIGLVFRYRAAHGEIPRVAPPREPKPKKPRARSSKRSGRQSIAKPTRKERPMLQAVESVSPLPLPPVEPRDWFVPLDPIPFLDRSIFECAWIVDGKDHRGLALCCGRRTSWGAYCPEHRARSLKNEFTIEPVTRAPTPAGMRFVWGA